MGGSDAGGDVDDAIENRIPCCLIAVFMAAMDSFVIGFAPRIADYEQMFVREFSLTAPYGKACTGWNSGGVGPVNRHAQGSPAGKWRYPERLGVCRSRGDRSGGRPLGAVFTAVNGDAEKCLPDGQIGRVGG